MPDRDARMGEGEKMSGKSGRKTNFRASDGLLNVRPGNGNNRAAKLLGREQIAPCVINTVLPGRCLI